MTQLTTSSISPVRAVVLGLLASVLGACATPVRSTVDVADDAMFGELKTFAWITEASLLNSNANVHGLVNPINEQRLRSGIEAELHEKGYRKVDADEADFVIAFSLGAREQVRVQQFYINFGYAYYGHFRGFSRFGIRFGPRFGGVGPVVNTRTFNEGTLVLDVFDTSNRQAIWHGRATRRLSRDDTGPELIEDAITTLLAEFPDREVMMNMMKDSVTG